MKEDPTIKKHDFTTCLLRLISLQKMMLAHNPKKGDALYNQWQETIRLAIRTAGSTRKLQMVKEYLGEGMALPEKLEKRLERKKHQLRRVPEPSFDLLEFLGHE